MKGSCLGELIAAFERDEFQMYIQFYVNAQTGQTAGGEALVRWQHPQRGFLTPEDFVFLMEHEDLITRMDYCMFEKVCAFLERLERRGIRDFFLSCNFSRKSFGAEDFMERCGEILERYSFARERLIFELTESTKAQDAGLIQQNIRRIKEKFGVRIVLDDFGTGFTSFFDLQKYPVDGIKLDKKLIDETNTPKGQVILRAMVEIGHELGLKVLAEGVESEEQLTVLRDLNCDAIQGFCFSHPVPVWEAEDKLFAYILEQ